MSTAAPPAQESETPKKTRNRASKVTYPGVEGGKKIEGDSLPPDYDPKKHLGLRPNDFAKEEVYWDWQALLLDSKAKEAKEKAEECRKYGSAETRKEAKRLAKLREDMASAQEALKSQLSPEAYAELLNRIS